MTDLDRRVTDQDTRRTSRPRGAAAHPLAVLGGRPAFDEPLHVTKPLAPDRGAFERRMGEVFDSGWFTNSGNKERELEERLSKHLEADSCALICNGTVALQVALRALGLSGEVITTPFTFPATAHAIEWNNLTPVFCDIDPETYALDPGCAASLVGEDTSGLLPVHVFGNPCDVEGLGQLANACGLEVVYDAAHAFGVRYRGRPIGSWGDLSVLSFHATKIFHTAEGGAILGASPSIRERIDSLRNFGIVNEDVVRGVGLNGKLSELHAVVGLSVIDSVDEEIRRRLEIAAVYRERLSAVPGLVFQRLAEDLQWNGSYVPIEVDPEHFGISRDELHRALAADHVMARKYFFPLCSENESYRHLPSAQPERLPNAHRVANRVLCLPIYGEMGTESAHRVADLIERIHHAGPTIRRACVHSGS